MNIESVKSLLCLFSGEDCADGYVQLISLAEDEIDSLLLPDADPNDIRLEFLCAALVNYRLAAIRSARDRRNITYAGKMLSHSDNSSPSAAASLLKEYLRLCSDLIGDLNFTFKNI